MSFDLYVWHESAPITATAAAAKVAAWAAGDQGVFAAHVGVPLLRAELLVRFPPGGDEPAAQAGDEQVVAFGGHDAYGPDGGVLLASCASAQARVVPDAVRDGAKRHGLVCYDPRVAAAALVSRRPPSAEITRRSCRTRRP